MRGRRAVHAPPSRLQQRAAASSLPRLAVHGPSSCNSPRYRPPGGHARLGTASLLLGSTSAPFPFSISSPAEPKAGLELDWRQGNCLFQSFTGKIAYSGPYRLQRENANPPQGSGLGAKWQALSSIHPEDNSPGPGFENLGMHRPRQGTQFRNVRALLIEERSSL